MSSLIGQNLGQYEVRELLGKGGMATVYKGYQPSIGRSVAIKVLPPHPSLDEQFIQRFELEARTIGSLQHPHILSLYDYGTQDDILYLVMQYADGGTLAEVGKQEALDVRRVERILRESASALDYAHRRGVVHRDIKPANILIDGEGHVLLADFGIVKMMSEGVNLTGTNIVGTPAYMAPEQGQGMEIDGRADVYALGCMFFELLTGKQPYKGESPMQVILKHISDPVPDIRDVRPALPVALSEVFFKVLAKDPSDRYQTAVQFAEAFSEALHGDSPSLASIRAETPLSDSTHQHITTGTPPPTMPTPTMPTPPDTGNPIPATIIMRDSTSPLILLGGFAMIAVLVVVIGALLLNQQQTTPVSNGNATTSNGQNVPPATEVPATEVAVVPPQTVEPSFGTLRYSTTNRIGDTLTLQLQGVRVPTGGSSLAGWLVNTATDEMLGLGRITMDALGSGVLVYTDADGRLLPAHYNALIITAEETIGEEAQGEVRYHGYVPMSVSESLRDIFVGDAVRGINGASLLDGALVEAQIATQHAGLASRARNMPGVRVHAEHTINVLRGTNEDFTGSGTGENPGRGIGIYCL